MRRGGDNDWLGQQLDRKHHNKHAVLETSHTHTRPTPLRSLLLLRACAAQTHCLLARPGVNSYQELTSSLLHDILHIHDKSMVPIY